ncbi:gamma-aminobutyric acid receptor subunit alpha-3 [Striga asiatica]|uniref:Gamma-aminobutyric acid receptor subunit alpha-3 n=1 Tax=Striga asiatica TaxID=4170 RepID=A0A5A7R0C7_STRAF|nr:gamma-aminobutyric acid receptor subunit alpha-3 [Striga asiatica]
MEGVSGSQRFMEADVAEYCVDWAASNKKLREIIQMKKKEPNDPPPAPSLSPATTGIGPTAVSVFAPPGETMEIRAAGDTDRTSVVGGSLRRGISCKRALTKETADA